jgi:F-type H+-transporting ATPase subunit epsilon
MADAATGRIILELVSPEKVLLSEAVEMAVLPGSEGLFGVLVGHAPLIAALRPGVVQVYENDKVAQAIFVDGGFAEVTAERCVVLAENAVPVASLDRATIQSRIDTLTAANPGLVPSAELPASGIWSELLVNQAMLAAIDAKTL